jgi:hypothetical protein
MNISEATRKAVSRYPYLQEYISQGLVNYRGLARMIAPEVSRDLGRETNLQSIVTALRRLPKSEGRLKGRGVKNILARSELGLKYDMVSITIGPGASAQMAEFRERMGNEPYILIQGLDTLTIIADDSKFEVLRDVFKAPLELKRGISQVVVKSPKEIATTPGVIAYLANVLAFSGINVVEMMSSFSETHFIVDESDALKAVELIRSEIKRTRS